MDGFGCSVSVVSSDCEGLLEGLGCCVCHGSVGHDWIDWIEKEIELICVVIVLSLDNDCVM